MLKDQAGDLEDRLKKDLLKYLFDNDIEFSIESQEPSGGGKVDILPVLPDRGHLPVEVKVFDGDSRNRSYVSNGLAQAAEYGRKFNKPSAYYFVYNVAENRKLWIPGIETGRNVVKTNVGGIDVYSIVANLRITLPPSRAAEVEQVEIPLPS